MFKIKNVVAATIAINLAVTVGTVVADLRRRNKKVDMESLVPTKEFQVIKYDSPHIAAATKSMTGEPIIIHNDVFEKFTPATQAAIIQHEVGHHVLGHLENEFSLAMYNNLRSVYPFTGNVISIELEADAYAAHVVGNENMINALKELKGLKAVPDAAKKEIDLRIKALGGKA